MNSTIPRIAQNYASQGFTNMGPVLGSNGFVCYIHLINKPSHTAVDL